MANPNLSDVAQDAINTTAYNFDRFIDAIKRNDWIEVKQRLTLAKMYYAVDDRNAIVIPTILQLPNPTNMLAVVLAENMFVCTPADVCIAGVNSLSLFKYAYVRSTRNLDPVVGVNTRLFLLAALNIDTVSRKAITVALRDAEKNKQPIIRLHWTGWCCNTHRDALFAIYTHMTTNDEMHTQLFTPSSSK